MIPAALDLLMEKSTVPHGKADKAVLMIPHSPQKHAASTNQLVEIQLLSSP